jgi:hypothetical protein
MPRAEKSVMDVFGEGVLARNRGESIESNPYAVDSKNHEPWRDGWRIYDVLRVPRSTITSIAVVGTML